MNYPLGSAHDNMVDDLREEGDSRRQKRRGHPSLHASPVPVREDEKNIGMGLFGKSVTDLKSEPNKMPATGLTSQQRQAQRSNVAMPMGSTTGSTGASSAAGSSLGSSASSNQAASATPSPSPIFTTSTAPSPAPGTTGSGLGSEISPGAVGSGIGSEYVGTSSASGMPGFSSSSGLENGVPRADSSRFMDDAVQRISGSGLSYWDEQKAGQAVVTAQPRKQSSSKAHAEEDEEDESGLPIGRVLIAGILFLTCLAMAVLAFWGLSAAMEWSKPDPNTDKEQFKLMGVLMLTFGSILSFFMGGASLYVMFLHNKMGKKNKRRR